MMTLAPVCATPAARASRTPWAPGNSGRYAGWVLMMRGDHASTSVGGSSRMSPLSTTRSGFQTASCAPSSAPHSSRVSNCTHGTMKDGMPYSSACAKPSASRSAPTTTTRAGIVGVGRRIEQSPQIRPGARDEDGDREHAASLPARSRRPSPASRAPSPPGAPPGTRGSVGKTNGSRGAAGGVGERARWARRARPGSRRGPPSPASRPLPSCALRRRRRAAGAGAHGRRFAGACGASARREQQDAGTQEHLESDGERDRSGRGAHLGEAPRSDRAGRDDGQQRGRGRADSTAIPSATTRRAPIGSAAASARSVGRELGRGPGSGSATVADAARSPASADVRAGRSRHRALGEASAVASGATAPRAAVRGALPATSRERAIQPASAPSATGPSASRSSQGVVDSGMIPRIGMPGTTPTCVPAGETDVPAPRAKPGTGDEGDAPHDEGRQVGELGEGDDGGAEHVEVRGLVEGDDLAAAQDERDGGEKRAEADEPDDDDRRSPRTTSPGTAPQPCGAASTRSRSRAIGARARLAPFGDDARRARAGTANTSVGKRTACQRSTPATSLAEVSATSAASAANIAEPDDDAGDPRVGLRGAHARPRREDRGERRERERGEREGEGCRVRVDAGDGEVVGRDRDGERHEVAELPDRSRSPATARPSRRRPRSANTHSRVSGARVAATPTATAMAASTAASMATMRRCMRHRP